MATVFRKDLQLSQNHSQNSQKLGYVAFLMFQALQALGQIKKAGPMKQRAVIKMFLSGASTVQRGGRSARREDVDPFSACEPGQSRPTSHPRASGRGWHSQIHLEEL